MALQEGVNFFDHADIYAGGQPEKIFGEIGVSNMNVQQLQLLARYIPDGIAINQMQIGLAHTTLIDEGLSVNTDASQAIVRTGGVLEYCRGNGITLQAWSPLQYGMFEGPFLTNEHFAPLNKEIRMLAQKYAVTDTAIAVAWLLRHPAGIQVITGTTNKDRLTGLCAAARVRLTRPEWYRLYRLAGNPLP